MQGELLLATSRCPEGSERRALCKELWRCSSHGSARLEVRRPLGHYHREYKKLFQDAWIKLLVAQPRADSVEGFPTSVSCAACRPLGVWT